MTRSNPVVQRGERIDARRVAVAPRDAEAPRADQLRIGDKVWFRHAKSGEICEHVDALEVLDGGQRVGRALTYRGEGKAFV